MIIGKAALLVIDVQQGIMDTASKFYSPESADGVMRIKKLLDACREADIPAVFFKEVHRPSMIDFGRELDGSEGVHALENSPRTDIAHALEIRPDDPVIPKRRYSGFLYTDLKVVLKGLAEDEQRHYRIVQQLQNQKSTYIEPDPAIGAARNVFAIAGDKPFIPKDQDSIAKWKDEQRDVYQAALRKEEESVRIYKNLKETVESPAEKDILAKLAQEEERHAEVLGNIIQMLNNFNEWVESAEFHHQKPY